MPVRCAVCGRRPDQVLKMVMKPTDTKGNFIYLCQKHLDEHEANEQQRYKDYLRRLANEAQAQTRSEG
jgi:hypothetical protein